MTIIRTFTFTFTFIVALQKAALEKNKKEMARLNNRLNHDKQGKIFIDGLTEEINLLREQIEDDNKVIEGLKLACDVSIYFPIYIYSFFSLSFYLSLAV